MADRILHTRGHISRKPKAIKSNMMRIFCNLHRRLWILLAMCYLADSYSFSPLSGRILPSRGEKQWLSAKSASRSMQARPLLSTCKSSMESEPIQEIFADRVLIESELHSASITIQGTKIKSVQKVSRTDWSKNRGKLPERYQACPSEYTACHVAMRITLLIVAYCLAV